MKNAKNSTIRAKVKAYPLALLASLVVLAGALSRGLGEIREESTSSKPKAHATQGNDPGTASRSQRTPRSSVASRPQADKLQGRAALGFPIVLTQLPAGTDVEEQPRRAGGMLRADYGERARVIVLHPDGTRRVLTAGFHSAADPDISFDGKRILFAAKWRAADNWNIYEMEADGSGVRQITRGLGDCRNPIYQSKLNTLVADKPWYQITFVSTAAGEVNEYEPQPSTSLYSCRLDGTLVSRLTLNPSSDFDPFLMGDGRLLLASWQRSRLEHGWLGRVGLFGVNQDGTDFAQFSADEGRRIKHMPTVTTTGLAVFVEADEVGWDGAGFLSAVTLRRHLHSYRQITQEGDGLFHSPSPLADGTILVSRRPREGAGTHGVYRLDPSTGRFQPVFDDPKYHDIQARMIAPRPEPDGRSTSVFVATGDIDDPTAMQSFTPKSPLGKLYCLNVNVSDLDRSVWLPPGAAKRVRVLESVPRHLEDTDSPLAGTALAGAGGSGATVEGIPPLLSRRFLGEVPVEEDGSFNIEVPADVPIEIQLLDEDGLALRSCGWIWVKNNEPRGCIGCHEDQELAPKNRLVSAVMRPSTPLTLPPERRRSVDFRRDVMPIIEAKCVACHGPGKTPRLDRRTEPIEHEGRAHFNRAYESLLATHEPVGAHSSPFGKYVHAGRARTSPLIWHIFGRNTSRPWDVRAKSAASVKPMPPSGAEPLTADEKRTFVEWIDTGAHWGETPRHARAAAAQDADVGRKR